jgi:hypothetical protein
MPSWESIHSYDQKPQCDEETNIQSTMAWAIVSVKPEVRMRSLEEEEDRVEAEDSSRDRGLKEAGSSW